MQPATNSTPSIPPARGAYSPSSPVFVDPSATVRTCRRCGETKPLTKFRVRTRGTNYRAYTCDLCYSRRDKLRARMRRGLQKRKTLSRSMTKIRAARRDQSVGTVCELLLKEFGGTRGLADAFAAYHKHALYQMRRYGRPNPLYKLMATVTRLWGYCDQRKAAHLAAMSEEQLHGRLREAAIEAASDDELQGRLDSAVRRIMEADPDWVAGVLRRAGWNVTRTHTCDCDSVTIPS
jgi:hypothetical protein